jgi:hypothetical protein
MDTFIVTHSVLGVIVLLTAWLPYCGLCLMLS